MVIVVFAGFFIVFYDTTTSIFPTITTTYRLTAHRDVHP